MSVYEIVNGMVADDMDVRIVRRDGYALCTMWSGKMSDLRADSPASVVAWGLNVSEVEIREGGVWSGLVLIV